MILHIPTLQKMRLTSQFFGIHGTYKSPSFIPSAVSPTRSPTKSCSKSLAHEASCLELTGGLTTATSFPLAMIRTKTYHNSSHIHILTLNLFTWHNTFPSPVVKKNGLIPQIHPSALHTCPFRRRTPAGDLDLLLRRSRSQRADVSCRKQLPWYDVANVKCLSNIYHNLTTFDMFDDWEIWRRASITGRPKITFWYLFHHTSHQVHTTPRCGCYPTLLMLSMLWHFWASRLVRREKNDTVGYCWWFSS